MKKIIFLAALSLLACDQGLSTKNEAQSGVIRMSGDAQYSDGDYELYFKSGLTIHNDCDGYSSTPNGKTTIYEYWQSDIKKWDKLLNGAGVPHETYKTGKVGKYCSVTFDTDMLHGIGYVGRGTIHWNDHNGQFDALISNGNKVTLGGYNADLHIRGVYYAPAHGKFYFDKIDHKDTMKIFNEEQASCDHAKILIEVFGMNFKFKESMEKVAKELKDAGANVIGTRIIPGLLFDDYYVVVAASSVDWFAIAW